MWTRRLSLAVVFAVSLAVTATSLRAQGAVALSGQVTSAEEGAMEGVLTSVKKAGATITVTVASDAQGRYRFPATKVEPGRYALEIRAVGYGLEGPGAVEIAAQTATIADLKLRKTKDLAAQLTNAEWLISMPGPETQKLALLGCVQCHTLERVTRSAHDAPGFMQVVQRMGTYVNQSTPLHIQVRRAERLMEVRGEERQRARQELTEFLAGVNIGTASAWKYDLKTLARPRGAAPAWSSPSTICRGGRSSRTMSSSIPRAWRGSATSASRRWAGSTRGPAR
jgi:hypothetical protein